MAAPKLADIVNIGLDILKSVKSAATGLITAQTGDVVSSQVVSDNAEWWQHVGFCSRPAVPTAGSKAAQCVSVRRSDNDAIIASRDARGTSIYGNLADGETCVYACSSAARVLLKADGSANVYTLTGGRVRQTPNPP